MARFRSARCPDGVALACMLNPRPTRFAQAATALVFSAE